MPHGKGEQIMKTRDEALKRCHEAARQIHEAKTANEARDLINEVYDLGWKWEIEINEKYEIVDGEEEVVGIYVEDDWYLRRCYDYDAETGEFKYRWVAN